MHHLMRMRYWNRVVICIPPFEKIKHFLFHNVILSKKKKQKLIQRRLPRRYVFYYLFFARSFDNGETLPRACLNRENRRPLLKQP